MRIAEERQILIGVGKAGRSLRARMRHVDQHVLALRHLHQIVGAADVIDRAVLRIGRRRAAARLRGRCPVDRMRKQQIGMPAERAAVVFLARHHEKVRVRMALRAFDRVEANLQCVHAPRPASGPPSRCRGRRAAGGTGVAARIDGADRRVFAAESNRVDLADDVDAERFEGDQIGNVGVEAAGMRRAAVRDPCGSDGSSPGSRAAACSDRRA